MAKDSRMYYIKDDIQKIQIKTNLFIKEYGSAGTFHMAREIIQNSMDECIDPDSPGNKILISYDQATNTLKCEDNGRGFPEKDFDLNIFCTTIQSGSKFFREADTDSSGEYGIVALL